MALNLIAQTVVVTGITAPWLYTTNDLDGVAWTHPGYDDSMWTGPGNALLYIETSALPAPKNTELPPRPDLIQLICILTLPDIELLFAVRCNAAS